MWLTPELMEGANGSERLFIIEGHITQHVAKPAEMIRLDISPVWSYECTYIYCVYATV